MNLFSWLASFVVCLAAPVSAQFTARDAFEASLPATGGPNFQYGVVPPGTLPHTYTFSSGTLNATVADLATSTFTLAATPAPAETYLWDLDVRVKLQHPSSGELDLYLVAPDGREVTLSTHNATNVTNAYADTTFDDSSDDPVVEHVFASSAVLTLVPEGALGSLIGLDPTSATSWTLRIRDTASGNVGTLVEWSLIMTTLSGTALPYDVVVNESGTFNHVIPDNKPNGYWAWAIVIEGQLQIGDVRVRVQVSHPRPSDLSMTLVSPAGTEILLTNGQGGSFASAFANVEFRDDARVGLSDVPVSDYVFSSIGPTQLVGVGSLSRLLGEDADGSWSLHVVDQVAGQVGTLIGFTVEADTWKIGPSQTGYCTSGTSTNGCVPTLSGGIGLAAINVPGQINGIFFLGTGAKFVPWGVGSTSSFCVRSPLKRTLPQNSGGFIGACNGVFLQNVAGEVAAMGVPSGTTIYAQCWYRDPPAVKSTNLTNAVTFSAP